MVSKSSRTSKKGSVTHKKPNPKSKVKIDQENLKPGRFIWKGYISFGLVNIPIVLSSAEKPTQEVHFKLLAKRDLAEVKYLRINEKTGKSVPWEEIVKGYEYEPGSYAILTKEDFNEISRENQKTIEIEDFVDKNELGTLYFEKPYYVLPDKKAEKGYVLLRETLKETNKIGIARVIIRTHQYLAAVMAQGDALIINTLRYPQEVKKTSEIEVPHDPVKTYKISKKEFDIAKQLVNTMTIKWNPKRYTNEYREELLALIKDKLAHGKKKSVKHVETKVKQTNVVDFMDLLKKSVKRKKLPKAKERKHS